MWDSLVRPTPERAHLPEYDPAYQTPHFSDASPKLLELSELLEARRALRASRAYREAIISARTK